MFIGVCTNIIMETTTQYSYKVHTTASPVYYFHKLYTSGSQPDGQKHPHEASFPPDADDGKTCLTVHLCGAPGHQFRGRDNDILTSGHSRSAG